MRTTLVLFSILVFTCPLFSSTYTVSGTVLDAENNEPLAFAGISIPGTRTSTLTDISGRFILHADFTITQLQVSYIGYETKLVLVSESKPLLIHLRPAVKSFEEVVIFPGENPAHRIIRQVMLNREINDPYAYNSFQCITYTKMYVTGEFPADSTKKNKPDSLSKARTFFSRQHLFITETVSEKKYKKPLKENERILGSRVSGFSSSPFFTPVAQLQSFSFYSPYITILDKSYVNPLAPGTFNRYSFLLEDTLFSGTGDTIFLVSFKPRPGKNFEAMSGVLYVHSTGYALYRVIAEPIDVTMVISPHIEQEYEQVNGKWFPKEMHTDWYYNNMKLTDSTAVASMRNFSEGSLNKIKVVCRTWVKDIQINELTPSEKFSADAVYAQNGHDKKDSTFWDKHRGETLDKKDLLTYRKVDSTGKAEHFEKKLKVFEAIATGRVPMGWVDLELKHLLRFNEVEKLRPGLGLVSSRKLSRSFLLEAYLAYGTKDKRFKYGGQIHYLSRAPHAFSMELLYRYDLSEPGATDWMEKEPGLNGRGVREYKIPWLEWEEKLAWHSSIRIRDHFKLYLGLEQGSLQPDSGIRLNANGPVQVIASGSRELKGVFQFRWQHNEKFLSTRFGRVSQGSRWPVLFFRWEHRLMEGPLPLQTDPSELISSSWDRYAIRIEWKLRTRTMGTSEFLLEGGMLKGNTTVSHSFMLLSSYQRFGYFAEQTFETMRYYEFAARRMLMLFHKHDFGKISRKNNFNPSIVILNNLAWGDSPENVIESVGISPQVPGKGFFESGFQLNSLLRNQFIGLGIQAMYRYGPYAFRDPSENYSIKSTLKLVF